MSDLPIGFSAGIPTTVLPEPDPAATGALAAALSTDDADRRGRVADVVARWPRLLEGWATLGDLGRDPIECYAYYRTGYHRGLDSLRAAGWRGSGYVRWAEPSNRGFLRAVRGLGDTAADIGETDEAERCTTLLTQLDPSGPWGSSPAPS